LLRKALDSVFAQTFMDYEVIVVDDGSTDETVQMMAGYNRKVRFLQQQNQGAGAARNTGAKAAIGDYLAFLDSDDVWFPWTLATYAQVIRQNANPSFVTGLPLVFTADEQLKQATGGSCSVEMFPDYYASSDAWRWFSASSFVIRKERFAAEGGFHGGWGAEDADLTMMLGTANGFVHFTAPHTFGYRDQLKSLKTMPTYALSGSRLMLAKEKNGLYPGGNARARARREILARQIRPVVFDCLKAGLLAEAWELYRATFRWNVALGRWKYLAAFPVKALLGRNK
jgi:cellulose synthase/poly-beta-1,6-N-acetylglucosamine synthase-like glycosyltransferase